MGLFGWKFRGLAVMPSEVSTAGADQHLGRIVDELKRELDAKSRELADVREQQAATAGILASISSSPADLPRVFSEIAANAARLCDASNVLIGQVDGDAIRLVAHHGPLPTTAPVGQATVPLTRGVSLARAVLDRQTIHVADLQAEAGEFPEGSDLAVRHGIRTVLHQPLIRAGKAVGAISIRRADVRPFTDRQIELLKTFADQAVVAIENARLFEEVQARTRELTEALEQQTATSEVLSVISRSSGEVQPAFEIMLANATKLCEASYGAMWLREGGGFRNAAFHGELSAEFTEQWRRSVIQPGSHVPLARAAQSRKAVHVADLRQDRAYLEGHPLTVATADAGGVRTLVVLPMLKEDDLVGAIAIYRKEVRPFTDKQIELLTSFAAQAVIAIENTRLLHELRESLQQQTATADVLKVISRATFDLPRVLDTLVESAASLCDSYDTAILQKDGGVFRIVAHHGSIPIPDSLPLTRGLLAGRAFLDRRTIHIADVQSETDEYPESSASSRRLGFHTLLAVPLIGAGEAVGVITLRRPEVRSFTGRQIELLQTFADQAVIA